MLDYYITLLITALQNDDIKCQERILKSLQRVGMDRQTALTAAFAVMKGETND